MVPVWGTSVSVTDGDLREKFSIKQALDGVDTLLHLATRGYSSANPPSQQDLTDDFNTTMRLAQEARRHGVRRFVFVSSLHVYGAALHGSVSESTVPQPTSEYGRTHLRIENELAELSNESSMGVIVVRLTNTFGVPEFPAPSSWNLFIHDLCRQAVLGDKLVLRTNGQACFDFLALGDAARTIGGLVTNPDARSGVYLVGSGQSQTLHVFAERVCHATNEMFGRRPKISLNRWDHTPSTSFKLESCKLEALGIHVSKNWDLELHELLRLARKTYSRD